jgi:phage terminase large subunit
VQGRLYLYREYYRVQQLVEDAAEEIKALTEYEPRPRAVICDHAAGDRATFGRHAGCGTTAAVKEIRPDIQAVQARLRKAADGRPRLFVLRDSLVRRDPVLYEAKKPCCLGEELDGYCWRVGPAGRTTEEPIDQDNHGADCLRYVAAYLDLAGSTSAYRDEDLEAMLVPAAELPPR